jgi:hypothetical protein
MSETCGMHGEMRNSYTIFAGKSQGKRPLHVDRRVILKCILKNTVWKSELHRLTQDKVQ